MALLWPINFASSSERSASASVIYNAIGRVTDHIICQLQAPTFVVHLPKLHEFFHGRPCTLYLAQTRSCSTERAWSTCYGGMCKIYIIHFNNATNFMILQGSCVYLFVFSYYFPVNFVNDREFLFIPT